MGNRCIAEENEYDLLANGDYLTINNYSGDGVDLNLEEVKVLIVQLEQWVQERENA